MYSMKLHLVIVTYSYLYRIVAYKWFLFSGRTSSWFHEFYLLPSPSPLTFV